MLGKSYTEEDVDNVVYEQIFPYLYVDDTQTQEKSYICLEVDVPRTSNFTIKNMKLIVWSYCHKGIMRYSKKGYVGTRADCLSDMIDRELNGSQKFGIGGLKLDSMTYFMPSKNHYGRQLIYTIPEFHTKAQV